MLMIFAVAAGTTILLGLGAFFGFWAGAQIVSLQMAEPRLAGSGTFEQALSDQLDRCLEIGDRGRSQSERILTLTHAAAPHSSELHVAVAQLHLTMKDLNEQLQSLRSAAPPVEVKRTEHSAQETGPADAPAPSPQHADARPRLDPPPASPGRTLTMSEISEAIGGRERMGETTFGLESTRYPYESIQFFAPCEGDERPAVGDFVTVRCHDISVGGMSFFLPDQPDFEMLVISLGSGEARTFMAAEVCQYKAVFMRGEASYLVNCRFVKRLVNVAAQWRQRFQEIACA